MKRFTGTVVRATTPKTVFVEVTFEAVHPKYQKTIRKTRVFPTHDEVGVAAGDLVAIVETKPMSATKFFVVESVVKKAAVVEVAEEKSTKKVTTEKKAKAAK